MHTYRHYFRLSLYSEQIRFVPHLRAWISCCKDRELGQSLFIGDIVALRPGDHYTYYRVACGVTTFDYSSNLNMIVSGGLDSLIRLWNPSAVGNKMVGTLEGHVSPITALIVNNLRDQLISIADTKVTECSAIVRIRYLFGGRVTVTLDSNRYNKHVVPNFSKCVVACGHGI